MKVSIPQAVSTVATGAIVNVVVSDVEGFNTASGKYCCNCLTLLQKTGVIKVSIPQAVSTVATGNMVFNLMYCQSSFNTASGKYCCNSSWLLWFSFKIYFNTASDKHCCNLYEYKCQEWFDCVSIPQAVSTVATKNIELQHGSKNDSFNTASGKHCCNGRYNKLSSQTLAVSIPQAVSTVATHRHFYLIPR